MSHQIDALLQVEIEDELNKLNEMEVGTDKHKVATEDVAKLMDRLIQINQNETVRKDQLKAQEEEHKLKLQQIKEDRVDRWVKNGLTFLGIALPLGAAIWGTKASFKFEQEGTITTIFGRGWLNKLLPKK